MVVDYTCVFTQQSHACMIILHTCIICMRKNNACLVGVQLRRGFALQYSLACTVRSGVGLINQFVCLFLSQKSKKVCEFLSQKSYQLWPLKSMREKKVMFVCSKVYMQHYFLSLQVALTLHLTSSLASIFFFCFTSRILTISASWHL